MALPYTGQPFLVKSRKVGRLFLYLQSAWQRTASTGRFILGQVLPIECLHCGIEGSWLCLHCLKDCLAIQALTCPFCDRLSEYGKTCSRCRRRHVLNGCRSVWYYQGPIVSFVHRFKYKGVFGSCEFSAPYLAQLAREIHAPKQAQIIVTSVPSTPKHLYQRGFNQSEVLARSLATAIAQPYIPLLKRNKEARSQTQLTRTERLQATQNQFSFTLKNLPLNNSVIIIVDDVITTGATLSSCAHVLKQAGAKQVWGLTIAKD